MAGSINNERVHHVMVKLPRPVFKKLKTQAKKNMRQPGNEAACIVVEALKSE